MNYPNFLEDIIEYYKSLPGIGEKNAIRLAFATIDFSDEKLDKFITSLNEVMSKLKRCKICGNICDDELCNICKDESRNHNLICVLEDFKSVYYMEKNHLFNGVYHVLNGLISPMDNINPEDVNINSLISRIDNLDKPEVILALSSTLEGNMTMLYIKELLAKKNVRITRLSYGLSIGSNLDYIDADTFSKALDDRKDISNME